MLVADLFLDKTRIPAVLDQVGDVRPAKRVEVQAVVQAQGPGPVADLLLSWIDKRDNMNTATNRNSRWLFPGRRAGQPMHSDSLAALVDDLGIPTVAGRASAIRQHVLEMPAPVVADALGYHQVTTAKLAAQAGGTWSRYASGDHLRSPSGWAQRRTDGS